MYYYNRGKTIWPKIENQVKLKKSERLWYLPSQISNTLRAVSPRKFEILLIFSNSLMPYFLVFQCFRSLGNSRGSWYKIFTLDINPCFTQQMSKILWPIFSFNTIYNKTTVNVESIVHCHLFSSDENKIFTKGFWHFQDILKWFNSGV